MKGPMITAQLPLRSLYVVLAMLFVLCAVAGYLYVLKQPLGELAALDDQLFETRRARPMDTPAADRIATVEAEILELRARLGGGAPDLAPNEMVAFVIGQLDVLARARRIQLVSVEPGATTQVFEFDEIPFHIEVVGGYFGLVEWLQEAENTLGPMVIKSFDIEPVASTEARRMRLTMVSYRGDEGEA